jgi:hypothetical protein
MSTQQPSQILCIADPRGDADAIKRLLQSVGDRRIDAIAVVGDLSSDGSRESHRGVLRALGASRLPTFWVPGPGDAPVVHYLREAHDAAVVYPAVRGIHGTAALSPDQHVLFAGMGGQVDDDPDAPREEVDSLRYPRWEAEYRMRILMEFPELQIVMLLATPPAHKGRATPGAEVLTELTATYRARMVVCGGEPMTELIGRTVVVAPGSLAAGRFAVADLHKREAALEALAGQVGATS